MDLLQWLIRIKTYNEYILILKAIIMIIKARTILMSSLSKLLALVKVN